MTGMDTVRKLDSLRYSAPRCILLPRQRLEGHPNGICDAAAVKNDATQTRQVGLLWHVDYRRAFPLKVATISAALGDNSLGKFAGHMLISRPTRMT